MNVLEAISTRRSIRKFTGEKVTEDQLDTILKAGFSAPSAHNLQPWHFIVLKNAEMQEQIAAKHPYAKMLPQAGCGIIVCGDHQVQKLEGFMIEDCSAAIQNILLAAHGIGLGAVWCGLHPVQQLTQHVSETLSLPDHIEPIGLIVIGQKAEDKAPADRYDKAKIHFDRW